MTTCNAELTFPPVQGHPRPRAHMHPGSAPFFRWLRRLRSVAVLAATPNGTRHIIARLQKSPLA